MTQVHVELNINITRPSRQQEEIRTQATHNIPQRHHDAYIKKNYVFSPLKITLLNQCADVAFHKSFSRRWQTTYYEAHLCTACNSIHTPTDTFMTRIFAYKNIASISQEVRGQFFFFFLYNIDASARTATTHNWMNRRCNLYIYSVMVTTHFVYLGFYTE